MKEPPKPQSPISQGLNSSSVAETQSPVNAAAGARIDKKQRHTAMQERTLEEKVTCKFVARDRNLNKEARRKADLVAIRHQQVYPHIRRGNR